MSHSFADNVAAVLAGQVLIDHVEFYACIADQPLNRSKTEALFSARAIGKPSFIISFGDSNDNIC